MLPDLRILIVLSVLVAVASFIAGWVTNGWRLENTIHEMEVQYETSLADAATAALEQYEAMERQKQEAIDAASRLAKENYAAASAARADADRLRQQLAEARRTLPAASVAAARKHAAALNVVLNECVAELEAMAEHADGHALDARTLQRSWPVSEVQ